MLPAARSTVLLASMFGVAVLAGCAETNPSVRYMHESRERYQRIVSLTPKFSIVDNDRVPMSAVCTKTADEYRAECGDDHGAENVQWKKPRERRVCLDWAAKLEADGDVSRASELYVKMCQVGFSHACLAEARLCAKGKGSCDGDRDKTLAFYVGGCHANDVEGCLEGQKYYLEADDWGTYATSEFLYGACLGGHRPSCRTMWKGPRPPKVPPSPNQYHIVVRKACILGDAQACVQISRDVEERGSWEAHWTKVEEKRRAAQAVHDKRVAEAVRKAQAAGEKPAAPEPPPAPVEGDLGVAFGDVFGRSDESCGGKLSETIAMAKRHCGAHTYWSNCETEYLAARVAEFYRFNPYCIPP